MVMSNPVRRVRQLALAVTALLLVEALPVESAVHLPRPTPEAEKAVSCTVDAVPQDRVTRDRDVLTVDGQRVAAGEASSDDGPPPRQDPERPRVCPLGLDQKSAPPRGNR
jgi:hypothetical protein